MYDRLNTIQKSMLQWNEMHPYTAIHAMRIRGAVGEGTTLTIRLPLPPNIVEESRARAAG